MNTVSVDIRTLPNKSAELDLQDIVEIIDNYPSSLSFIRWLSNDNYKQKVIFQNLYANKYTLIVQCYIDSNLVFTGRKEYFLDKLSLETRKYIVRPKDSAYYIEDTTKMHKNRISKILAEPSYTVISYIQENEDIVGMSWEMYELPALLGSYTAKEDPLLYWKTSRRG